jgi:hypothetical protein
MMRRRLAIAKYSAAPFGHFAGSRTGASSRCKIAMRARINVSIALHKVISSGAPWNTVIRLEQGVVDPRSSTLASVRRALDVMGIEFLSLREESKGIRVRRIRETHN